MARGKRWVALSAVLASALVAGFASGASQSDPPLHSTEVVSRADGKNGALPNEGSLGSGVTANGLSANGRYAVFTSLADNLSAHDAAGTRDVFVRDVVRGRTILISRRTDSGSAGNDDSSDPAISANGECVAFVSQANNLSPVDDNDVANVFLRNLRSGRTSLISVAPDGSGGADDSSAAPDVSDDCRRVAFGSNATNLSNADVVIQDVFLRDLDSDETILVSRATGSPGAAADGGSFFPSISGDGTRIAFHADADNLSADDGNFQNTYVRLLGSNQTLMVNRATGSPGTPGNALSGEGEISRNGRYVAFTSNAGNLSADDVAVQDAFVRDLQTNTTTLVSRESGIAPGNGGDSVSFAQGVSGDGRFVAFDSSATNLSADDIATSDAFVRDLVTDTTFLVSRRSGMGAAADGSSFTGGIADGGRYVIFSSDATNLGGGDDGIRDAYRREVFEACAGKMATLTGTNGTDELLGTAGADVIVALGGNDVVDGRGGNDLICGGPGADTLKGSEGRDTLFGESGADKLRGGPGRDKLNGGPGNDDEAQ